MGLACAGSSPDLYLILRQTMMVWYAIVFLYAFLLFGDEEAHIRRAAFFALGVSVLCAVLDTLGWLTPKPDPSSFYSGESFFGQETLPIAILGLGLVLVHNEGLAWRVPVLCALLFVGWRQNLRVPQSVVPIGIGGALMLYLLLSGAAALRGQMDSVKRAVLLAAFFGILFLAYRGVKKLDAQQGSELHAWSWRTYSELFAVYDSTTMPADPKDLMRSPRDPNSPVNDLESYKLNAVYMAAQQAGGVSVINNVWRLLMWRRMLHDWRSGSPWLGAGVGHDWEYNKVLRDTWFHYEPDAGGLNPHNSYLNLLYRCGIIGVVLLLALMAAVLYAAWHALIVAKFGDVLLEGIMLYFFYTAVFAFFTVSFEGPSYSLPLWTALGLLYARARQVLARARLGIGD